MSKNLITRKNILIILAILIIAGIGALVNYWPQSTEAPVSAPTASDETYTNEKGEKWGPLSEEVDFTVASKDGEYPSIVSGLISPLKVVPGDVQKMEITINSDAPIVEALAEIETDNGIETVPLQLIESSVLTEDFFNNRKYIVSEDGKLLINSDQSDIKELVNKFFRKVKALRKAEAQGIIQYTYGGEWTVHDTHVTTYHTTFVVRDELGRSDQIVMAWSDPCSGIRGYGSGADSFTANCTVAGNAVEGTELGNLGFDAGNWTVTVEGRVRVNSGYSFKIENGGKYIITGSGLMDFGLIYLSDGDSDSYGANNVAKRTYSSGGIRMKDALGDNDCCDEDARAKPGQTSYYTSRYTGCSLASKPYDFNCDSSETKRFTNTGGVCGFPLYDCGSGCSAPSSCGPPACDCMEASTGWVGGSAPACGSSATYIGTPLDCTIGCTSRTQSCR